MLKSTLYLDFLCVITITITLELCNTRSIDYLALSNSKKAAGGTETRKNVDLIFSSSTMSEYVDLVIVYECKADRCM